MTRMDIEQARLNMIEQQIRTWEVLNQEVLDLLNEIHREEFIPAPYKNLAFADMHIPIGHGQATMTPSVEARLLQSVAIRPDDSVLEIGTGCGYLSILLAKSAAKVKTVDLFPDFVDSVKTRIEKTGLDNIEFENGDAYSLLDNAEKFNVIVLTASLPVIDDRFLKLLEDQGRLFVIIGESPIMEARVYTRQADSGYSCENIFETDLPALIGSEKKETFSF